MRTVGEIVTAVQEQQPATEDELRLALLCLFYQGQMAAGQPDFETASEVKLRMRARDNWNFRLEMMREYPSVYLGKNWTPGTPENRRQRECSKRLLEAFERNRGCR